MSITVNDIENGLKEGVSTDDLSAGGPMPDSIFTEFFDLAVDSAEMLDMIRTENVAKDNTQIFGYGVGERMMRGQAQGATGARGNVRSVSVPINCEKSTVHWDLPNDIVENTPPGESVADRVMDHMTEQFSADVQDLAANGNEEATLADLPAGEDEDDLDFVRQNTGFIALAQEQGMSAYPHVDGTSNPLAIDTGLFSSMIRRMPTKYRSRGDPVFMVSMNQLQAYREHLSDNYDDAGFQVLMGDNDVTPFSYDVFGVTNWPDDVAMFTPPRNLVYALSRDVEVDVRTDTDRTLDEDLYGRYAIRVKHDFAIENIEAGVLATDIAVPTPAEA